MVGFSDRDIRNEVARIFKSEIEVDRTKGVVNSDSVYQQTKDISALTFLTNPDAIFYLTQLATNALLAAVKKEVAVVEDMLFSIDYVSNRSPDYRDANTELNNATTALLALDSADSINDRPELARFTKNITKFSERMRRTTARSGSLALAGGEAKWSIREDMKKLETQHADTLLRIDLLSSLLEDYEDLDVQSIAAKTMLRNTRLSINRILSTLERDSVSSIGEKTKSILLRSLTSKASVNFLAAQTPHALVRHRGPANPTEEGVYYGRVAGDGTAAVVKTSSGPWETPLTDLNLKVDGGAEQTFTLGDIPGVSLTGRNKENFGIDTTNRYLHVVVDPESHEFISDITWFGLATTTTIWLSRSSQSPFLSTGFKHLGSPLFFSGDFYDSSAPGNEWDNVFPAVITELGLLATYTSASWSAGTSELTVVGLTNVKSAPGAAEFDSEDIGRYVKVGSSRYEIVDVTAIDTVVLETFGATPSIAAGELRGQDGPTASHTDQLDGAPTDQQLWVEFSPALTSVPSGHDPAWKGKDITIGPAVKTGDLTAGDRTVVEVTGDLNSSGAGSSIYTHLWRHVVSTAAVSDAEKVQIVPVSQINGLLRIVPSTMVVDDTTRQSPTFLAQSTHQTLGFLLGSEDSGEIVQPQELVDFLSQTITGATVEVVDETVYEGVARTTFGTTQIEDTEASFSTLGVVAGYQVEIYDGTVSGFYRVDAVPDSTHLTLRTSDFPANENISYRVLTQKVSVTTLSKERGTSLEVTSAPAALGMSSAVQYGSTSVFEAVDKDGNSLEFKNVKDGDTLSLSEVGDLSITNPAAYQLTVDGDIPTSVEEAQFSVLNAAFQSYQTLKENLDLFKSSKALLGKHKLSTDLSVLDAAISPVVATGSFAAATNRASRILADLLSLLTSSPLRAGEYSTSIPTASLNLQAILGSFYAAEVPALKALSNDMRGRKYERAVDMLLKGDIKGFFEADKEDASYSGAMAKATRTALQDLPDVSTDEDSVGEEANEPIEDYENPNDPDFNFEEDDEWLDEAEDDGDF